MKNTGVVLIEGLVIGIILVILYTLFIALIKKSLKENKYINLENLLIIFVSGALIHIIFEYTGLNKKYVDNYYK